MCYNPNMATQQNEADPMESKQNVATTTRKAVVEVKGGGGWVGQEGGEGWQGEGEGEKNPPGVLRVPR